MPDQFKGPLGIWRWPILSFLMSLLSGRPGERVKASNLEHWRVIKDAAGDITDVIVKRDFARE